MTLKDEIDILILNGITSSDPILYRQDIMDSIISIESRIPILKSKMDVYGSLVKQYEVQLSDLPSKVLEFTRLERDQNIKAETVKFMSQKLEETKTVRDFLCFVFFFCFFLAPRVPEHEASSPKLESCKHSTTLFAT